MASVPLAFQRYAASGGVSLGRPILLLHGVFGSKNNWKSMAKKLAVELRRNVRKTLHFWGFIVCIIGFCS